MNILLVTMEMNIGGAETHILELAKALKDKKNECNFDQNEFDLIDERLDKIKTLKKKYGATIEDVLNFSKKSK